MRRFISALIFLPAFAIGQSQFQDLHFIENNADTVTKEYFHDVIRTSDGGYVLTGRIWQNKPEELNGLMMKIDEFGQAEWAKKYWFLYDITSVVETPGNDLILCCTIPILNAAPQGQSKIVKTSPEGDIIWAKTLGGYSGLQSVNQLIMTKDKNYVGAGTVFIKFTDDGETLWSSVDDEEWSDFWRASVSECPNGDLLFCGSEVLIRSTSEGEIIWTKRYENLGIFTLVQFLKVLAVDNEIFLLSGTSNYPDTTALLKTDSSGTVIWSYRYELGNSNPIIQDFIISEGNSLLLTGYAGTDAFISKLDYDGNEIWTKTFWSSDQEDTTDYESEEFEDIIANKDDGSIVACGYVRHIRPPGQSHNGFDYYDGYVIKADSLGNSDCYQSDAILFQRPYEISSSDHVPPTMIAVPEYNTNDISVDDLFLIRDRLCSTGIFENEQIVVWPNNEQIVVWPNPFEGNSTVWFKNEAKRAWTVEVYDVTGRILIKGEATKRTSTFIIDGSKLISGLYIVKVSNAASFIGSTKIVVP